MVGALAVAGGGLTPDESRSIGLSSQSSLLILNYNHCRFFSTNFFNKKKQYHMENFEIFYHMKSLRPLYFFCMSHYCLSIVHSVTGLAEILLLGFITPRQTLLLCLSLFLSCADVGTIFNRDSGSNLISLFIAQNSRKLSYYLFTCSVLFVGLSVISFELFYTTENFASVQDSMVTLSCLMFGDSVLDVFDSLEDVPKVLVGVLLFFIFVFFLNVLQIFLAVASVGFQKVQEEFNSLKEKRKMRLQQVQSQSRSLLRSRTKKMNLTESDYEKKLRSFLRAKEAQKSLSGDSDFLDSEPDEPHSKDTDFERKNKTREFLKNKDNWTPNKRPRRQESIDSGFDESKMIKSIVKRKSARFSSNWKSSSA